MLSKSTEGLIAKILMNIAEKERSVDITCQVIADYSDFDPYQLFIIFDKEGKKYIDENDVIEFLRRNGIYTSLTEVKEIIMFYDQDGDGYLNLDEWLRLIVSEHNLDLRQKALLHAGTYTPCPELSFNIEYAVVKFFEKELELARSTLELLDNAMSQRDFNVHSIFHRMTMTSSCNDYVKFGDMKRFLEGNYCICSKDDIRYIMKRVDIDNDGRIGLDDLHTFFTFPNYPKSCKERCVKKCDCWKGCNSCCEKDRDVEKEYEYCKGNEEGNRDLEAFNGSFKNSYKWEENENKKEDERMINNENKERRNVPERKDKDISRNRSMSNEGSYSSRENINGKVNVNGNINENESNTLKKGSVLRNHYAMKKSLPRDSPKKTFTSNKTPIRHYSSKKSHSPNHTPYHSPHHNFHQSPHHSPYHHNIHHDSPKHSPYHHNIHHTPHHDSPHHSPICCHHCHCSPCQCCEFAYSNGETQFLTYFKEVIEGELQIEQAKKELALRADFNIEDTYQFFISNNLKIITEPTLKYGLNELTIHPSSSDLNLLMKRGDINHKGSMNYKDLLNLVTPYDKGYRSMVSTRRPSFLSAHSFRSEAFLPTTKLLLQKLLQLIMKIEGRLFSIKNDMCLAREYSQMIFDDIDRFRQGRFTVADWKNYLIRKGVLCGDEESTLAFNRLDYNCNGYIEYCQLISELD